MLPAVPGPGRYLRSHCLPVEQQVARRLRLERLGTAVQLAPGADGGRPGGGLRLR